MLATLHTISRPMRRSRRAAASSSLHARGKRDAADYFDGAGFRRSLAGTEGAASSRTADEMHIVAGQGHHAR